MIQRDTAAALLEPLARPTQDAFDSAIKLAKSSRAATGTWRSQCTPEVLSMLVGVEFWAFFSSDLCVAYRTIPNVAKVETVHKLQHAWLVGDELRVQLKSDIAALDVEQLMIPGIEKQVQRAQPDIIALTWSHAGEDRFAPAFVHVTKTGQAWRLPLAALLEQSTETIVAETTKKSTLTSRIKRADERGDDAGADGKS